MSDSERTGNRPEAGFHATGRGTEERSSIRAGEELPIESVDRWLRTEVAGLAGLPGPPIVTQFAGGASNWTYRLRYPDVPDVPDVAAARHDYVLRRGPSGTKAKSAHDMGREFRLQRDLRPFFPQVPEMVAHCADPAVAGAEFYVMRRVDGVILRRDPPPGVTIDATTARALCERFLDTLVALHRVDVDQAGLAHLGRGAGFVTRQVEGWSERYRRARTWNVPRGERLMRWLAEHKPAEGRLCVTHNDFRFDNLVLDRTDLTRVVGVLDWELATIGDPWMDLGNSLAYWVEATDGWLARRTRRQPTHLPGMMTRRELRDGYAARTGARPENPAFYEVFGLFRLSVIAQQIYYRYHRRETRNPAFRAFWIHVRHLHRRAAAIIEREKAGGQGERQRWE